MSSRSGAATAVQVRPSMAPAPTARAGTAMTTAERCQDRSIRQLALPRIKEATSGSSRPSAHSPSPMITAPRNGRMSGVGEPEAARAAAAIPASAAATSPPVSSAGPRWKRSRAASSTAGTSTRTADTGPIRKYQRRPGPPCWSSRACGMAARSQADADNVTTAASVHERGPLAWSRFCAHPDLRISTRAAARMILPALVMIRSRSLRDGTSWPITARARPPVINR